MSHQGREAEYSRRFSPEEDKANCTIMYNPYKQKLQFRKKPTQQTHTTTYTQTTLPKSKHHHHDNQWIGENLSAPPPRKDTRFMLLNINGIQRSRDKNHFRSQLTTILEKHVHYMALTETWPSTF